MRRTIVEPADVSGTALAELKNWLGITRPNEDDLLVALLKASVETCEAFTGQTPLSQTIEMRLPVEAGRTAITARPVASVVSVELVAQDNTRSMIDAEDYELDLDGLGGGCFHLQRTLGGRHVSLRLDVGIASIWEDVPAALKQGIIRLTAFQYRDRDRPAEAKTAAAPPASVAALWRPWRTLRLA